MSGIIWIASYPKSGNTWFRIFLSNYQRDGEAPVNINQLNQTPIASAREIFDTAVGVKSSDLTEQEIEFYRPEVYDLLASTNSEPLFMKIHDAYTFVNGVKPLVSNYHKNKTIYIIRNPLDVAISYSHHSGTTIEQTIQSMGNETHAFCSNPSKLHHQLYQRLDSWSGHVKSWTQAPNLSLHVIRYEDMLDNQFETFSRAIKFTGLKYDSDRLQKALRFSNFKILKEQEEELGFQEKNPKADSFFRNGKSGNWRDILTIEQQQQIIDNHFDVMYQYGYITENGELIDKLNQIGINSCQIKY